MLFIFTYGCAVSRPPSRPPEQPKTSRQPKPYKIGDTWYQPISQAQDFREQGLASWYGEKFHGRKTASGETYNMYAMTAAHKMLPLGTHVRVHNRNNNKTVVVRINDRGPFIKGRIIDLSYTAAKALGVIGPGTAPVEILALGTTSGATPETGSPQSYIPLDYYRGNFTFQIGAFTERTNAENLKKQLSLDYKNAHITTYDNGKEIFYRVRVGKYDSLDKIRKDESIIQKRFVEAIIVAE